MNNGAGKSEGPEEKVQAVEASPDPARHSKLKRLYSRLSLRQQLLFLFGFMLLLVVLIGGVGVTFFVFRTEQEVWRGRQLEAANNASYVVSMFLHHAGDSLDLAARFDRARLEAEPEILQQILRNNPDLLELVYLDEKGKVLLYAARENPLLADLFTVPQSRWFSEARQGRAYFSDLQVSYQDEPYLILSLPAAGGNVVAARLNMEVLWQVVAEIHFGEQGIAYVVDRDGQVIAHPDPALVLRRTSTAGFPELSVSPGPSGSSGFDHFFGLQGDHVLGAETPLEGTDWLVITELPSREAYASTRNALLFLLAGMSGLGLLVIKATSLLLETAVLQPVGRLQRGANQIGQGNLSYRIETDRSDEIGLLAQTFNQMAAHLNERDNQLAAKTAGLAREVAERRRAEETLKISQARYRAIVEDQTELICRWLPDGTLTFVNEAYCRYFDRSRQDLIGHSFIPLVADQDRSRVAETRAALNPENPVMTCDHRVVLSDGSTRWQRWTDRAIYDEQGQLFEIASVGFDITEQKNAEQALQRMNDELEQRVQQRTAELAQVNEQLEQAAHWLSRTNMDLEEEIDERKRVEEALRESEERYILATQGANDGLWDWDLRTSQIYFSPRWKSMLGYAEEEIGSCPEEWYRRVHPEELETVKVDLAAHLKGLTPHFQSEHRMLHKDGVYRWMHTRGLAVRDENRVAYRMAGSQTDITVRKKAEEQLLYDAFHDTLTGLPNRALFLDRLGRAIERSKRRSDYQFAVLFMDLDRFKVINDSLGHTAGDELLIMTARRLNECLRSSDTAARLGGDEFVILVEDLTTQEDALQVAERIQEMLKRSFYPAGQECFISASIGIVTSTGEYERPDDLLRDADIALYHAKSQGRARYEEFDTSMRARAVARLELESELRRAVERQDFKLHYQAIQSLESGRITGFEALLRWSLPERGNIPPLEFIPVAEETGLIIPIGEWVLREACRQTVDWQSEFRCQPPLTINVNISGKQFSHPMLVSQVQEILQETGLEPSCLKLEITESVFMDNVGGAESVLNQLRQIGVQLQIDDFGTGYSSLSYLQRFPIDTIKIDRSFINRMGHNGDKSEIVKTIVALAHDLGMDAIAEGVETEEQLYQLKSLDCQYGQGYYIARPADPQAARTLLEKVAC